MSDPVREAVLRLLRDRQGLSLVDDDGTVDAGSLADLVARERDAVAFAPSGPVFLPLGNRIDLVARFLGFLAAGLRPVILPARVPPAELAILLDSFPVVPLHSPERGFVDGNGEPRPVRSVADEYTMVLPTSGSTGVPRLIVGKGERVAACVEAIAESQGLAGLSSTGAILPAHFSYCLVNQVMWSLLTGAKLVLTGGIALPGPTLELLRRERAAFVCVVAQQMRVLRSLGFATAEYAMPDVRVVNCAGGPFAFDSWKALQVLFPKARFNNNYGCTEAFPRVSARQVLGGDEPISDVGTPIRGLEVWVADDEGRRVGTGVVGRIWCRGVTTGVGTLRADGSVEPWSVDGSFPSGDHGAWESDGHLHVYGRADQIINVGGERVSLIKIESIMRRCPGVEDAVATGIREETGEQWPLVILNAPAPPSRESLRAHLLLHLSRGAWPQRIHWAASWPLLPSDKPDRKRVIAQATNGELPVIWQL